MDYHKAIRAIHNSVVTINGDTQKTIVATDKDNKEVIIDWTKVKAWKDPNEYQYKRELEYPSIPDQLDKIYYDGIDKWKSEMIKPIKDKYPKDGS